jgi:hypothetical protein
MKKVISFVAMSLLPADRPVARKCVVRSVYTHDRVEHVGYIECVRAVSRVEVSRAIDTSRGHG